jgi:hypothetical protein
MAGSTSRLALALPQTTDAASELRGAITTNADVLDNATLNFSGTLANRGTVIPSPVEGMRYYATDIPGEYLYDGTTWQPIGLGTVSFPTRAFGSTYQPNVARPTHVALYLSLTSAIVQINFGPTALTAYSVGRQGTTGTAATNLAVVTFIVPAGWYYEIAIETGTPTLEGVIEWTM